MTHDIFLSHSVKEEHVADSVVAKLEAESVSCWIAPRDVVPGAWSIGSSGRRLGVNPR